MCTPVQGGQACGRGVGGAECQGGLCAGLPAGHWAGARAHAATPRWVGGGCSVESWHALLLLQRATWTVRSTSCAVLCDQSATRRCGALPTGRRQPCKSHLVGRQCASPPTYRHTGAPLPLGACLSAGADRVGAVAELACALCRVEDFYDSIGGLLGYQRQCLQLIAEAQQGQQQGPGSSSSSSSAQHAQQEQQECEFLVPPGVNLSDPCQAGAAAAACAAGLAALPRLAEIYPLGGAGDRLGLRCERSGEGLPTAVLQYCGRTLLEALVRDVQVGGGRWHMSRAGRGRSSGGAEGGWVQKEERK